MSSKHVNRLRGRALKTLLTTVLDTTDNAIVSVDEGLRIIFFNAGAERLFGYPVREVIGEPLDLLLPSRCREVHDAHIEAFSQSAEVSRRMGERQDIFAMRRDGTEFPVEVSITKARLGDAIVFTAIVRDISAQRREATHQEQLHQSEKMEAVGQLAGGIAHDLNNILTVILGYCDMVIGGLSEADPRYGDLREIWQAGTRASALVRQLLAFSRRQFLHPRQFDLNTVISGATGMLRRMMSEDIELVIGLEPDISPIKADPGQLEQIILNLAMNARDAMPRGGRLTIHTANVRVGEAEAQPHAGFHPGLYVVLSMSDTGHGMDAQTKTRIFEPFFTTKERGKGTGLGLSTVYGVVMQSGGFIRVDTAPGQGTTFRIYLPYAEGTIDEVDHREDTGQILSGSEVVLVVEDELEVLTLISRTLQEQGYTVLEAHRPEEALRVASDYRGHIDLIVSDVVMPQMSGPDLAPRLTGLHPEARVLFVSGYTNDAVVCRDAIESGESLLEKPFSPAALLRTVRDVLDRRARP